MEEEEFQIPEEHTKMIEQLFYGITRSIAVTKVYLRRNRKYLEKNHAHIGKILSCHLVIENLMGKWLFENKHCTESQLKKMNFNSKLLGIKDRNHFLLMDLVDGIGELNKLRNFLVHDIDFKLESATLTVIDKSLRTFSDFKVDEFSTEKKIQEFTNICIFFFALSSKSIKIFWNETGSHFPTVEEPPKGFLVKSKKK